MTRYRFMALSSGVSFAGQGSVTEFSDVSSIIEDLGNGRARVTRSVDNDVALGDWDVVEFPWSRVSAAYPQAAPAQAMKAASYLKKK